MSNGNAAVVRQMARLFDEGTLAGLSEGQLLDRFLQGRDESAFEVLVERHSRLVMGVCRRVLGDAHDAEDAFQATFLLLARKAGSVRHRQLLGGWLHRVAYRVATRSGQSASRRRAVEKVDSEAAEKAVSPSGPNPDLSRILHEELARLSDNDRAAVVLCDLEGLSHSEAAARLNWPVGTVKGRLSRARDRLRGRLVRRGLTLPAGLLASSLACEAKASVPRSLISSTVHAAALASAGHAVSGAASASAAALASGVARTMMVNQMKIFASLFLAGSLVAAGTGAVLLPDGKGPKADPPKPKTVQAPEPEAKLPPEPEAKLPPEPEAKLPPEPEPEANQPPEPEAAETDMPSILGIWKVLYVERNGRIERAGFFGRPSAVRFDEDGKFQVHEPVPSKALRGLFKEAKYAIDPNAKPETIDLTVHDERERFNPLLDETRSGIYRIAGDTMSLCLHSPDPEQLAPMDAAAGPHRPSGFATSRDDGNLLLVLKRGTEEDFSAEAPKATNELVGTWRGVEYSGGGGPRSTYPETYDVVVLPDRIFWGGDAKNASEYVLNTETSPKRIDIRHHSLNPFKPDWNQLGLYERDGEVLRLCLSTSGSRPKSFDEAGGSDANPRVTLQVFRYIGPPRAIDFEGPGQPSFFAPAGPETELDPVAAPEPPKAPDAAPVPQPPKPPTAAPSPRSDQARIQGRWDVRQMDGWAGGKVQHHAFSGLPATFGPESVVLPELTGRGGQPGELPTKPMDRMFYTLAPQADPKAIDLELGSTDRKGVYRLSPDGNELSICLGTEGSPRPAGFWYDKKDAVFYHLTRRDSETADTGVAGEEPPRPRPSGRAPDRGVEGSAPATRTIPQPPKPEAELELVPIPPEAEGDKVRQARGEKQALVVQLAKPAAGISQEERDQLQNRLAQYRERESVLVDEAAAHRQALAEVEERIAPLEAYITSRKGSEKVNRALAKLLLGDQAEAFAELSGEELRQVLELSQEAKDRAEKVVENWAHLLEDVRLKMDLTRRKLEAPLAEPRKVKPGDILIVEVLEALPGRPITGERVVRPDGTVSLGFYGDVAVAGLDRNQIKERIVVHLRKYLDDKALGLVEVGENGQPISVPPAESGRVFVDEAVLESIEILKRRLEGAVERVEHMKRQRR